MNWVSLSGSLMKEKRMINQERKCCICGCNFTGWGNNPYPVVENPDARCCDACNDMKVIPARIQQMFGTTRKDNN